MYPTIYEYDILGKYINLQLLLSEEKETEEIRHICLEMLKMLPTALAQEREFGEKWKLARRKSHESTGIYLDDEYYEMHIPIRITSIPYKKLAIIYEKEGNYSQAIQLCEEALSFGFTDDGTKGGMEGRLAKLKKKAGL